MTTHLQVLGKALFLRRGRIQMAAMQSYKVRMLRDIPVPQRYHSGPHTMTSSQGGGVSSGLPDRTSKTRSNSDSGSAFRIMGGSVYAPLAGKMPMPCGGGSSPVEGQREAGGLRQPPGRNWKPRRQRAGEPQEILDFLQPHS